MSVIDPSKCASGTCNFNNPSEFKIKYRVAADPTVWFPDISQVYTEQIF